MDKIIDDGIYSVFNKIMDQIDYKTKCWDNMKVKMSRKIVQILQILMESEMNEDHINMINQSQMSTMVMKYLEVKISESIFDMESIS